jgi:hypothetical protein
LENGAMAAARKTEVRRYFKAEQGRDGAPVPGTEDEDVWIDMELITGFTTEQGSGVDFKRRVWALNWESTARTIVWTKIYKDKDNDPDAWVLVPIPEKALFESGSGESFRRFTLKFDNTQENLARDVTIWRVFHAEYSGGKVDVDKGDYLDVEVIKKYVEEYGEGVTFHRERWFPANDEVPVQQDGLKPNEYRVKPKPGAAAEEEVWPSKREEQ